MSFKFAGQPDYTSRAVGMNKESLKVVRYGAQSVNWTQSPTEVANGIFVTGENPRQNNFENTSGRFFFGEACSQPDSLVDNQALLFDTRDGLAVVLDCGHAGVEIALEYNRLITGNRPIRAVIGGMHLAKARPERVTKTLEAFRRWNIQQIVPGHCTGVAAVAQLRTAFLSQCALCATGTRLISG